MTYFGIVCRISVIVAFVAVVLYHPSLDSHRDKLIKFLSTCPLHWFNVVNDNDPDINNVVRMENDVIMTKADLSEYHGGDGSKGLYIGILGRIYDVSNGAQHYGPGGGYHFFAGVDGTKAFVTGEFNEAGLIDEVNGLKVDQMLEILNWIHFYEKTYVYVGKLVGNFYDVHGNPTEALYSAQKLINEALEEKKLVEDIKKTYPPCNTYWSDKTGSKVWCTENSGGTSRGWEGVPRQLFNPVTKSTRCACVRTSGPPSDKQTKDNGEGDLANPNLREYEGCERLSSTCFIKQ